MKDVITGPGEYRMRDTETATVLAIVGSRAIGYILDEKGKAHCQMWLASTGRYTNEDVDHDCDILPPEPVITGPGIYEFRDGVQFHCAGVDEYGIARGFVGKLSEQDPIGVDAETGKYTVTSKSDHPRDVIRKRVTP